MVFRFFRRVLPCMRIYQERPERVLGHLPQEEEHAGKCRRRRRLRDRIGRFSPQTLTNAAWPGFSSELGGGRTPRGDTPSMRDRAGTSGMEAAAARLIKAYIELQHAQFGGAFCATATLEPPPGLLARLDGDWQAGSSCMKRPHSSSCATPLDCARRSLPAQQKRAHKARLAVGPAPSPSISSQPGLRSGRCRWPARSVRRRLVSLRAVQALDRQGAGRDTPPQQSNPGRAWSKPAVSDRVGAQDFTVPEITSRHQIKGPGHGSALAGACETRRRVHQRYLDGLRERGSGLDRVDLGQDRCRRAEKSEVIEGECATIPGLLSDDL